jgi:hypothetical protein
MEGRCNKATLPRLHSPAEIENKKLSPLAGGRRNVNRCSQCEKLGGCGLLLLTLLIALVSEIQVSFRESLLVWAPTGKQCKHAAYRHILLLYYVHCSPPFPLHLCLSFLLPILYSINLIEYRHHGHASERPRRQPRRRYRMVSCSAYKPHSQASILTSTGTTFCENTASYLKNRPRQHPL